MGFTIEPSSDGRYLICRVTGAMTLETARDSALELDRLRRETGVRRFLTDVRGAPNVATHTQNYEFAERDMPSMELERNVRAAVLADPDDRSHDFVETVARNRGYNVRIFRELEAAVAWLVEGEPGSRASSGES